MDRTVNPEWWFPVEPHGPALALLICSSCPVRIRCASEALAARIPDGVWGGLTEEERRILRRNQREEVSKQ